MPYSNAYTVKLGDLLEDLRDVISDLSDGEDTEEFYNDALSELYDAENSIENAIAELKK